MAERQQRTLLKVAIDGSLTAVPTATTVHTAVLRDLYERPAAHSEAPKACSLG